MREAALRSENDSLNLRCFDQKRRFGVDFLYPIERYVEGLTQSRSRNRAGELVQNPLYSDLQTGTAIARDVSLVFLAGIIGVPWQDSATDDTLQRCEPFQVPDVDESSGTRGAGT